MADIGVGKTKLFELKRDAMSHFEVIYEKNAAILRRERKSKRNDN
jgi:hypothetical protein